jgi:hypothetical protein
MSHYRNYNIILFVHNISIKKTYFGNVYQNLFTVFTFTLVCKPLEMQISKYTAFA